MIDMQNHIAAMPAEFQPALSATCTNITATPCLIRAGVRAGVRLGDAGTTR